MKIPSFRLPVRLQILVMFSLLTVAGAYLLLGQQTPSEESDWPWKAVTESKVFLNGQPAGKLSSLVPLADKINRVRVMGLQKHLIDQYTNPPVLLVPSPMISISRLAQLSEAITVGTGDTILVSKAALNNGSPEPSVNPMAIVVTTENVDMAKAKRLANLKDADVAAAGNHVIFMNEGRPELLRYARTYNTSIEISSDGKYYFNEQTAANPRNNVNLSSRMLDPGGNVSANANFTLPPVFPVKQRPLSRAELKAAIAKLLSADGSGGGSMIGIIASEKAPYESLLQIIEALGDPAVNLVITVRGVEIR